MNGYPYPHQFTGSAPITIRVNESNDNLNNDYEYLSRSLPDANNHLGDNSRFPRKKRKNRSNSFNERKSGQIHSKTLTLKTTSLVEAARTGDLNTVKKLLELKCDINEKRVGCTALHYAAFYNFFNIVEYLVESGADVNPENFSKVTPLSWAVDRGHLDIVKYLIDWEADVNMVDQKGEAPLHKAIINGNFEAFRLLVEEGECDIDKQTFEEEISPLHLAITLGHDEMAKYLIHKGANLNIQTSSLASPLHRAVSKKRIEIVKLLLEKGADVNIVDETGRPPLHLAAFNKDPDTVGLLLQYGAVDVADKSGTTALHLANLRGSSSTVELLSNAMQN